MSFTRVKPGGWAVGDQLTSSQQNQLDIDHANALDKTAAGDTLSGTVTVASGAGLSFTAGSTLAGTVNNGSLIVTGTAQIELHAAGTLGMTTAGAIGVGVIGGIQSAAAGGIQSTVVGGIELAGGATDWVGLNPSRSKTSVNRLVPVDPHAIDVTNWLFTGGALISNSTAAVPLYIEIPGLHHGATLSTVTVNFIVVGAHASAPSVLPSLTIKRVDTIAGGTATGVDLSATAQQFFTPAPANGAAWVNGNLMQSLTYTCSQNNVIDLTRYVYYAILSDESGAGAVSGNSYFATIAIYTGIASMTFMDGA